MRQMEEEAEGEAFSQGRTRTESYAKSFRKLRTCQTTNKRSRKWRTWACWACNYTLESIENLFGKTETDF